MRIRIQIQIGGGGVIRIQIRGGWGVVQLKMRIPGPWQNPRYAPVFCLFLQTKTKIFPFVCWSQLDGSANSDSVSAVSEGYQLTIAGF
jgi:hypothetical protein